MPSFDVVSKVQWNEVDNALGQAQKELSQRFDFQGTGAAVVKVDDGLLVTASTLAAARATAAGAPPDKDTCIAAFDRGQTRQTARRLKDARADLVTCSSEACPDLVRVDCAKSLMAVDAALPTVVFTANKLGVDRTDFRLFLDGAQVTEGTEGRAISVDPGPHGARFELDGNAAIELPFVAREGEKNRSL